MSVITYQVDEWSNLLDLSFLHQIKREIEEKKASCLPLLVSRFAEPRLLGFIKSHEKETLTLYKIAERAFELHLLEDSLLQKMLEALRKSGILSPEKLSLNLSLVSREGLIEEVDRDIFVRFSPFFRAALEGSMRESQENKINFPEDSAKSLKALVQYAYQETLPLMNLEEAIGLYKLAHRLSHKELQKACGNTLKELISTTPLTEELLQLLLDLIEKYPSRSGETWKYLCTENLLKPFSKEISTLQKEYFNIPLSLTKLLLQEGVVGTLCTDRIRGILLPSKNLSLYTPFLFRIPQEKSTFIHYLSGSVTPSLSEVEELFGAFPYLTNVEFKGFTLPPLSQKDVLSCFSNLSHLTHLTVQGPFFGKEGLTTENFTHLLSSLHALPLQYLDVGCNPIEDVFYEGEEFLSLKTLYLYDCRLQKAQWTGIAKFPTLQSLNISSSAVTNGSFAQLAQNSTQLPLEEIDASCNYDHLNNVCIAPGQLSRLRKLNLKNSGYEHKEYRSGYSEPVPVRHPCINSPAGWREEREILLS